MSSVTRTGGIVRTVSRRATIALPLALAGCGVWDNWFGEKKIPIPGKREPVLGVADVLAVESGAPKVVLPPPVRNAAWPQAGGNPAHLMGHLEARSSLSEIWEVSIGAGGGYRQKILAQPVVANGVAYAMDSSARVMALGLADGRLHWRFDTRSKNSRSTNIGGGMGLAGGVLYAVNGLGDVVALDAERGTQRWRVNVGSPGRSSPTIVEGRVFLTTIEDRILALEATTGRHLWDYQAANAVTAMLGEPAPAYADGLVVAGFASGELTALHAESGVVLWTDNLVASGMGGGLLDINSVRGRPVISGSRVFAVGLGGLTISNDLHSGRRLWDKMIAGLDSPWVAGDWVFLVTLEQVITALHAPDGVVGWARQLPRWMNPKNQKNPITWFGPVLASDRLVLAGTSRSAIAVSPYTGEILGQQRLSGEAAPVEPVIADGTVLIVTEDGRLLALR